jgi:hypothetical protein
MTAAPARRGWFSPSGADVAFLVLALIIFQACRGRMLSDPGLGWHIRNIDAMFAKGGWLTEDPFSGPRGGQPWWTNQWLGELPFWLGERWAGLEGIAVVATLVLAFTFRCLYRMLERDGLPWPAAALWTALAAAATSGSWVARPNLFTLLFTLVTARACESYHSGRQTGRRLAWLVPLFAVWANTHGGFVAGLVLLAAACAIECGLSIAAPELDARVDARRKAAAFGALAVASGLATLCNPYGYKLYAHVFQLLGDRYFMGLHAEWRTPQFNGDGAFQFEILMLLFPLLLAVSRRRANAIELGMSLLLFHFALTGLRYLPLWVLVVTPLLARSAARQPWLEAMIERLKATGQGGQLFATNRGSAAWIWSVALAIGLLAGSKFVEGRVAHLLPEIVPAAALDRLLAISAEEPGAVVFHSYNWGGYLTWHGWQPDGSGFRNWIDDRNEVQGRQHVQDYFATLEARDGWRQRLDRDHVDIVCVEPDAPLVGRLVEDGGWRELYRDDYAVILERTGKTRPTGNVAGVVRKS